MLTTNLGDLFSRNFAIIYSHNYRRSPKYSKIKQQILLYCTISSTTHKICGFYRQETNKSWHHHHLYHYHHHQFQNTRFVDFIGKKPTKKPTISSETINITIIIIFTLIISSPSTNLGISILTLGYRNREKHRHHHHHHHLLRDNHHHHHHNFHIDNLITVN